MSTRAPRSSVGSRRMPPTGAVVTIIAMHGDDEYSTTELRVIAGVDWSEVIDVIQTHHRGIKTIGPEEKVNRLAATSFDFPTFCLRSCFKNGGNAASIYAEKTRSLCCGPEAAKQSIPIVVSESILT